MSKRANITSIDAVDHCTDALQQFTAEASNALTDLLLEARRAIEWIENDRPRYWANESRKASDAVSEALKDLERCELTIMPGDDQPCYEERKALARAKQRQRYAEEKVEAVRRWRLKIQHASDEFEGRLSNMNHHLENEMPRAVAALKRMAQSLDKYTRVAPTAPDAKDIAEVDNAGV